MKERLQKLLAQANIASRRASEDLITHNRVRVNGAIAKVGDKADPAADVIEVDGVRLKFDALVPIYIALNKPKQVLSTDKPHRGDRRSTVSGLIGRDEHLFSIGRLDADSEGLVVMTNDGDLAQRLSHPRYRHSKTYRVEVLGLPTAETIDKWQEGIYLEEGKAAPCFIEITKGSVKGTTLRIVMTEGKKRQIRRVAAALGHPVQRLIRTHIGMLALGDLAPGASRELTPKEVVALSTPSPEIKTLHGQRRRVARINPSDTPDEPQAKPRTSRARPSARPSKPLITSDDEPQEKRRAPRVKSSDSPDQPRASRARPSATPGKPLTTSDDEPQEKRPTPHARKRSSSDDKLEKRRTPRAKKQIPSGGRIVTSRKRTPRRKDQPR